MDKMQDVLVVESSVVPMTMMISDTHRQLAAEEDAAHEELLGHYRLAQCHQTWVAVGQGHL